jgi:ribosomal protein S18 acetylase RimI-like enzyme
LLEIKILMAHSARCYLTPPQGASLGVAHVCARSRRRRAVTGSEHPGLHQSRGAPNLSLRRLESLTLTPNIERDRARYLELERAASRPYGEFVYGGDGLHAAVHEYLLDGGAAEFSPPEGKLVIVDGEVVGMCASLPCSLLRQRRARAAYLLARSPFIASDADLRRRIHLAAGTLVRPADNEVYLRRIAIAPAARGRGLASAVLARLLREARAVGAARYVLEVAPTNTAAVALYGRHGFVPIDERSVTDGRTGRVLSYLHMVCTLGS